MVGTWRSGAVALPAGAPAAVQRSWVQGRAKPDPEATIRQRLGPGAASNARTPPPRRSTTTTRLPGALTAVTPPASSPASGATRTHGAPGRPPPASSSPPATRITTPNRAGASTQPRPRRRRRISLRALAARGGRYAVRSGSGTTSILPATAGKGAGPPGNERGGRRPGAGAHPGGGGQARGGRPRPGRQGGGQGVARRGHGGHLHRAAPDPGADRGRR